MAEAVRTDYGRVGKLEFAEYAEGDENFGGKWVATSCLSCPLSQDLTTGRAAASAAVTSKPRNPRDLRAGAGPRRSSKVAASPVPRTPANQPNGWRRNDWATWVGTLSDRRSEASSQPKRARALSATSIQRASSGVI